MCIFSKLKKLLFLQVLSLQVLSVIFSIFAFCSVFSAFAEHSVCNDGINTQINALTSVVSNYIDESFKSNKTDINLADLNKKVQEKTVSIGLDLVFRGNKESDEKYVLYGFNKITNDKICAINIDNFSISENRHEKKCSYKTSAEFNPNPDGCIKSAQDSKLYVNKPLEAVFYKNGNYVDMVDANNFAGNSNCCDKNTYKVIQYPSLHQKDSGPCGYYSINNILKASASHANNADANGQISCVEQFLNRRGFEPFYNNLMGCNSGKNVLSQIDIADLINNNLKDLCQANVMICFEGTNNLNRISDENIVTFSGGGKALDRIRDFQINGTPQYLIIGSKEKKHDQSMHINGLTLSWDNFDDRLYCVEKHWFVLKIEWLDQNRPGACPVILSIFDSSGPKDSRFAVLIHWYYYIFTHTLV